MVEFGSAISTSRLLHQMHVSVREVSRFEEIVLPWDAVKCTELTELAGCCFRSLARSCFRSLARSCFRSLARSCFRGLAGSYIARRRGE